MILAAALASEHDASLRPAKVDQGKMNGSFCSLPALRPFCDIIEVGVSQGFRHDR